jgi:hypothetical protein
LDGSKKKSPRTEQLGDSRPGFLTVARKGRAWVSEDDYELVKLEADISQAINFGLGLLAKIQPGSRGTFEWRKINNEVWLPYRADFAAKVRILLVKDQNIREVTEYSDHKKFVVSTEIRVQ